LGASSGTLYFIKSVVPKLPPDGLLFVVPGTELVLASANLNANGWDVFTPLTSK
jgi:hypothetical protein